MNNSHEDIELSIVIPCYNESGNINQICEKLNSYHKEIQFELLLVNNGSTDNTSQIIDEASKVYGFIKKINIFKNIGYGHGILTGIKEASADIIAFTHADLQTPPEDVIIGYKKIKERKYNISKVLLKGVRKNRQEVDYFTYYFSKIVQILLGFKVEDINGQPKIFHKKLINKFSNIPNDSSFDAFVLYSAKISNLVLETFPVRFEERVYGESHMGTNVIGKIQSGFKQLKSIFILSWKNRWHEQNLFWQLIRYSITGLLTILVNYVSFIISLKAFDIYYLFSSIIGAVSGIFIAFFMHRSFTFRASKKDTWFQMYKFSLLVLLSIIFYPISIFTIVNYYGISAEYGQIISIPFCAIINFICSKLWVFRLENMINNIQKSWKN